MAHQVGEVIGIFHTRSQRKVLLCFQAYSAQMDAISQSLAELSTKVDDITHPKRTLRKPIGYEAIDAERKAKTNKENNEDN